MSIQKFMSKVPSGFLTILLLGMGAAVYYFMPVRMLPGIPPDSYLIEISSPGLTPAEFDRLIVNELEQGLMALPCRKSLNTQVRASTAQLRFLIKDSCQEGREVLKNRILEVIDAKKPNWPRYTELTQSKFIPMEERWEYLIEGADPRDPHIRPWLKKLTAELRMLDEVKDVEVGLAEPKLTIELDVQAMKKYGMDASTLAQILRDQLRDSVVGVSSKAGQNLQFSFSSPIHSNVKGLEELVLRSEPHVIRLKDVAVVNLAQPYEEIQTYYNGRPGIFVYITENERSDIIKLQSKVSQTIKKNVSVYNKPLDFKLLFDNGRFMGDQVQSISDNALLGVVTMLLFLGIVMGFRAAFAQLFSTPVIVASTLIVMFLTGQTLNLICIMGMFIVLGIMVDDSVIVSDTYMQWRRKGFDPSEASVRTARSLVLPLITTFVAITCSLLPVFFWSSSISQFMKPIAIIFIAALGLSLLECLTLLPAHLRKLDRNPDSQPSSREKVWAWVETRYFEFLVKFLRFRWIFVPVFFVAIGATAFLAFQKLSFVDHFGYTGERLHFYYKLNEASHDELSQHIKNLPETVLVGVHKRGVSQQNGKKLYGEQYGQITLVVVASSEKLAEIKHQASALLLNRLQQQRGLAWFDAEKGNEVARNEDLLHTPLYIEGNNMDEALWARSRLEEELRSLPGFVNLEQPQDQYAEHFLFVSDFRRLAAAGIRTQDLSEQTAFELAPQFLGRIPWDGELIDVRLVSRGYDALSSQQLQAKMNQLKVIHPLHRTQIPLETFGAWKKEFSETRIVKHNGIPTIKLEADFDQSRMKAQEVFKALKDISDTLKREKPQISIRTSEAKDSQDEELMSYLVELGLAASLVYVLVALVTGSYIRPFSMILSLLPIIGVVILALYAHSQPLSMLVFVGLMSVFGISMNDGLIILFKLKEAEARNALITAVVEAVGSKLRAVLITGTCAAIGLLPIAYSTNDINLFVRPIAFGAMWGLFASVIQALFLLPSLLVIEGDGRRVTAAAAARWQNFIKRWPSVRGKKSSCEGFELTK